MPKIGLDVPHKGRLAPLRCVGSAGMTSGLDAASRELTGHEVPLSPTTLLPYFLSTIEMNCTAPDPPTIHLPPITSFRLCPPSSLPGSRASRSYPNRAPSTLQQTPLPCKALLWKHYQPLVPGGLRGRHPRACRLAAPHYSGPGSSLRGPRHASPDRTMCHGAPHLQLIFFNSSRAAHPGDKRPEQWSSSQRGIRSNRSGGQGGV